MPAHPIVVRTPLPGRAALARVRSVAAPVARASRRGLALLLAGASLLAAAPGTARAQQVDLVLNATDTPDPVPAGGVVTYAVAVANNAPTTATGISYAMTVPANARYVGFAAGTGASCTGMAAEQLGPGTVTCTVPSLAFEAAANFSIRLRAVAQGTISVSQVVTAAQPNVTPGNNSLTSTTTVVAGADVRLGFTAPATAAAGSTIGYGLSITNAGPDAATFQRVTFQLPTGFTRTGALPAGCSGTTTITCDVNGPVAVGATVTIGTISGRIGVASGSNVTASPSVAVNPTAPPNTPRDPDTDNNTVTRTTTITAGSDVRITKARSTAGPYFVGDAFNFVLTPTFDGDSPLGLTVTDVVPTNYTIGTVAVSQNGWSCGVSGQTVTCTRPNGGAAGANRPIGTITIPVTVNAPGVAVVNSATITASSPIDPDPGNNTGNDGGATLVTPTADLAVTKTGPNPALVVTGVPFTWTLGVSNGGPRAFHGQLVVTDTLPANVTITAVAPNGWSCTPAAPIAGPSTLTCTRTIAPGAPLANGGNAPPITLTAVASATGPITNTVVLTTVNPNVPDPNLANNVSRSTVSGAVPGGAADLRVRKSVDLATVAAGEVLTYTLEVVNDGPVTSTAITLTDNLLTLINNGTGPTGQGFVGATVLTPGLASSVTCTSAPSGSNGRTLSCAIPSLPVCQQDVDCPRIAVAIRPGGDGGTRTNSATAISADVADPDIGNNTGTVASTIDARADISVTKSASPDPVAAGQALTYVVAIPNAGPSRADNVVMVDSLPLGVRFISATPGAGSCAVTPGAATVTAAGNRVVQCEVGAIANGAQRTVTIVVRPTTALRGTTITNVARVTTTTTEPAGADADNRTTRDAAVANPSLDLLVNKSESVDPLVIGDQTIYTVTASNTGPSDAEELVITDTLPSAGLSFQSFSAPGGSCDPAPAVDAYGGVIRCTFPRLASGASQAITVTMRGDAKGVYTNRARISSTELVAGFDVNAGNDAVGEATTVRTRADVQVVSKAAAPSPVALRRPYAWTIVVRNALGSGFAEADNVVVTDTLPLGSELTAVPTAVVNGTTTQNSCTSAVGTRIVTCAFGTMNAGTEATITVPVRTVTFPAGGSLTNTARIGTTSFDPTPGNNVNSGPATITASSIGGRVFRDFAANGTSDPVDTGIIGVGLTLTGTAFDGAAISVPVTTDANGAFAIAGLPEGTYTLTRGTVSESFLVVGQQTAGSAGGNAATPPAISGIALAEATAATSYLYAFVPQARIGVAKRTIGAPVVNPDGSFTTTFRIGVRTYALETLNAVMLVDTIAGVAPRLGTYVSGGAAATLAAGSYTINAAPSVVGTCSGATVNAAFTGDASAQLATIPSLAPNASCEFDVTVRYRPVIPLPTGGYANTAVATATGALSGQAVTDRSQNGADPDPNGDGDPRNNDVPTPVVPVLTADVTTAITAPATVPAGQPVNATVAYRNTGPYPASGMTYTMTLTPGLTGVTVGNLPAGATAIYDPAGGTVAFTGMPTTLGVGAYASGDGTSPIIVTWTQNATANSTLASTIATTTNEGANTAPNSATATVTGPLVADVTTTLGFPASANAGQPVSGTVIFRNTGPSTASSVTYTLTLAPGLGTVSVGNLPAGASASYDNATGTVTLTGMPATLAPNAIASGNGTSGITVSYVQPASGTSTVSSTIGTTTSQGANAAPDAATTPIAGAPIADVTTALSFPASVDAGQPVSGTITFRNDGPSPAQGVTYTLTLVPGLTGVTIGNLPAGASASYDAATGAVTFTGMPATLASGQLVSGTGTSPITLTYTQPGTGQSTIASRITTTTDQGVNAGLDNAVANPGGGLIADVRALVSAPTTIDAGNAVATTVRFSNLGPSTASGMTYALALTPGLANVAFTNLPAGASATYDAVTGTVTFAGMPATLASGALASGDGTNGIGVSWTQNAIANSRITATVGTTTNQGANVAPDSDTRTVTGALIADVTTSLGGFPTLVAPGQPVSGRLTFRNAGPSAASGVTYAVQLAPGLGGVTVGNLPAGATTSYDAQTGRLTFAGMPATIAPNTIVSGDGTNGLLLGYVQSTALRTDIASTIATSTSQGTNVLPDAAAVSVSGLQGTNLVVLKTVPVSEVTPVDTIAYTLLARNDGPVALPAGGTITDAPVTGITIVGTACAPRAGNLCTTAPTTSALLGGAPLPALPVGGAYELLVRAAVTAPNGGSVTNRALVTLPAGFFDTDSTSNQSTSGPIPVRARPDLAVTRGVDADTLRIGGSASWIATILNRGTATTTGTVTVTETLPAGLVPRSATSPDFACTITGQTVSCTRTTPMGVGDSTRITIGTTIAPTVTATTLGTTACQATPDDVNATNDCGQISRPVSGRREATLAKALVSELVVGEPATYRLSVRNSGTVPLTGPITVTDSLPRGLTFRSAAGSGWRCTNAGGVVSCETPGPIVVGDSAVVALGVDVGFDAVPQVTNCATVSVAGGAVLANDGRACLVSQARGDYRLVLELTTPRYDRELQDVPDFTVIVRNVGRSPLPAVTLTNLLPRGFTYVSGTSRRGGMPDPVTAGRVGDPSAASNNAITWPLGDLAIGGVARIDYRALIGIGATFDADNITTATAQSSVPGLVVTSNTARVPIRLRRGLFDDRGTIAGKVFVECDCDRTAGQGRGEVGIPGVRVLLEDGTGAITDVEGKYNFINVRAGLHVVKVDRATLPKGAALVAINTRNAGDGYSRFVDLKAGELHRADFVEGSRAPAVLDEVLARRRAGEPTAAGRPDGEMAQLFRATQQQLPVQPAVVQPGQQAPVLGAEAARTPVTSEAKALTFVPLADGAALTDGNSTLPPSPERARTALVAQPNTTGRQRVTLTIARDAVPADGRAVLPVTVRIFDSTGVLVKGNTAVTLEASAGGWQGADANRTARGMQVVVTDGIGTYALVAPNQPVAAELRATAPLAQATRAVTFIPEPRPFAAIGLLQGRVDLRSLARGTLDLANSADAFEGTLRDISITRDSGRVRAGARGALLLKGDVKGAGLLTLAYDTERDPNRTQFRDITPDEGWSVFGDGSLREFDAQSRARLYLRLDRGTSFLRFGDFATPRSDERRQLLAYDRSLTGLTYHAETGRGVLNTFIARNAIRQVVDELQGRGLSGPYLLTRPNAVINSERVELVTRDRNQPSVILRTQPMLRFEEYTIEPLTGRLIFRAPVPSLDANLNPVTIRVTYEVDQGGSEFLTYGGDGRVKLGRRLEVGGFAVRDENPVDRQQLLGGSISADLGAGTTGIAEFARTETGMNDLTGEAWRTELRHQSKQVEGRIFAMQSDTGFANRSSTFGGGRRELGLRWSASLTSRTRLIAEALRTEDLRTDGRRSGALLAVERRLGGALVAELGYRWADENGAPVSPVLGAGLGSTLTGGRGGSPNGLTPISFSAARARLTSRLPGSRRSSIFGEYEFAVDGSAARRGAIGGEYLLFDRARLYLRHEWLTSPQGPYALGDDRSQQQTVFGIDASYIRNGQVFSEYRARDAFSGRDAEASIGLRNRWAVAPGVLVNTTFERVTPVFGATQGTGTAFAATGGLEWTKAARWKGTARLEYRTSPAGDNVLASAGYARKLSRDWTLLGRTLWDEIMGSATRGRSQLGFAWRQTDANRVNALFRVENRLDRADAQGQPTMRTLSNVAAAIVNVQPVPRLTLSTRYAAKLADDRRDDISTRSSAQLLMARTIYDVSRRVDVGVIGSVMGNGGFDQRRYGLGGELGVVVMRNLRVAGGYNVFGFTDRDFAALGYTQRGAYLEFGFKFDESLFGRGQRAVQGAR
ncbi:MAG: hypothetical protein MUE41_01700 [Gemmatimonadaceae bacterium]|jgi:uncharacterized repeat protein (TIGR01451 family)|nr:hypothetical protein [Gemmatimonadaceae bacterium]